MKKKNRMVCALLLVLLFVMNSGSVMARAVSKNTTDNIAAVNTGDTANFTPLIVLVIVSLIVVLILIIWNKKRKKSDDNRSDD